MNKRSLHYNQLSPREMQALYLLICGRSTREMAERLQISVHTAHHHRRCVYEKLNVHNTAQLMREAFLEGWLVRREDSNAARGDRRPRHQP
ncbi:response regulator transcription factor [Solimonas variicoloris]|uniref:response regulator transcription factor n=1 Tax=Solimonas variicoloris TaxID=254408 RepID=UPI00035DDB31|nr:helix-turn-helix transcriptional regulator [Solimonas variicoloris]